MTGKFNFLEKVCLLTILSIGSSPSQGKCWTETLPCCVRTAVFYSKGRPTNFIGGTIRHTAKFVGKIFFTALRLFYDTIPIRFYDTISGLIDQLEQPWVSSKLIRILKSNLRPEVRHKIYIEVDI